MSTTVSFMKIPTLFGFPLWLRLKRRVVKKHFNQLAFAKACPDLATLSVGDWINSCDGYNHQILGLNAGYYSVGRGQILQTVSIKLDTGGSCSGIHCGIELPLSQSEIESRMLKQYSYWEQNNSNCLTEECKQLLEMLRNGQHIVNERGQKL